MRRRRFLAISAAALAIPVRGRAETVWRGRALGADVSVTLTGDDAAARRVLPRIEGLLARTEAEFSLYDATSALSRLNRTGVIKPSGEFSEMMRISDDVHRLTGGAFDPTIQALWRALAEGRPGSSALAAIGWPRVAFGGDHIRLPAGGALTFNGIAQGYATDRVRELLSEAGFTKALVDIGEYAALGGPYLVGVEDPEFGLLGRRTLRNTAIATSSPGTMHLGAASHILSPHGTPPLWSTVSVEASSATLADGLSTGLCFLPRTRIAQLVRDVPDLLSVNLVTPDGDLVTV